MHIPVLEFDTSHRWSEVRTTKYVAASEDLSKQIDFIQWWSSHETDLPNWAKACRLIFLVQPSSAASERVISILTNTFSSQQESSLEDYIQLSVILQYNSSRHA